VIIRRVNSPAGHADIKITLIYNPRMAAYIVRDIDDDLWRRVKTKAAAEGVTAKDVILRLLAEWATARNKAS
jgi:hypothetical protein